MIKPPLEFETQFITAGWTGDSRGFPPSFNHHNHVGWDILDSFNDIHIHPESSTGLACATNDIHFQLVQPLCTGAERWQSILHTEFIGVAFTHQQYCVLWVATDGAVFTSNDITNVFGFVGSDIRVAIRNELMGIRNQPLMNDDESVLTYYGDAYNRGDSRLFDWHLYASQNGR